MMREVPTNFVMILIAAIVNMVIGLLWYSPVLFGNPWMKLSGMTKEKMAKTNIPKTMGISFISALLMAFVLHHSIVFAAEYFNMKGIPAGIMTAWWTWVGFIMPVQLTMVLFQKQPFKLFLILTSYQLVSLLAMAIVLSL